MSEPNPHKHTHKEKDTFELDFESIPSVVGDGEGDLDSLRDLEVTTYDNQVMADNMLNQMEEHMRGSVRNDRRKSYQSFPAQRIEPGMLNI